MDEYIKKKALLDDIDAAMKNNGMGYVIGQTLKRYVKRQPAADVVPVVHGEWISVKDRLPKDERPVLTFVGYEDSLVGFMTVGCYFYFDAQPHWQWDGLLRDKQRTLFWMPLPEPPERLTPKAR